jgi:Flp pilus assembly protein TadD
VGLVLAVYSPVLDNALLGLDDQDYIVANPHVWTGLSGSNAVWAFTSFEQVNWHPLTWLSLQADVSLFGLSARAIHCTNVVLHAAAAVILFAALRRMTDRLWRSALVAAFFALHPLRVESVAWATERKDVLAMLFGTLTLLTYACYVRKGGVGRYLLVVGAFALGLLAKPSLVTLPAVLLLLDWWPLGRLAPPPPGAPAKEARQPSRAHRAAVPWVLWRRLLWEKTPLFALAAASCVLTMLAQREAMSTLTGSPPLIRLANALVSYVIYLRKTLWPMDLAALYPYPLRWVPSWETALEAGGAALLLAAISVLAVRQARSHPYLLMGWLWYLGTMVPVIGLVQVGSQARADRYTYLPSIGLAIAAVWGAADLAVRWQRQKVAAYAAVGLLVVASVLTWGQVHVWHDDVLLWESTLAVTGPENPFAQDALGAALSHQGRLEEAIDHFRQGLQVAPADLDLRGKLGATLLNAGFRTEAVEQLTTAAEGLPEHGTIQHDLGVALYQTGHIAEAIPHLRTAVRVRPDFALAWYRLGQCLYRQANLQEAEQCLRRAVELEPNHCIYRGALGYVLSKRGLSAAAAVEYRKATHLSPSWVDDQNRAAAQLATQEGRLRNPIEALDLAERICDATEAKKPQYLSTLAAAQAATGDSKQAAATARKALDLLSSKDPPRLGEALRQQLAAYQRRAAPEMP